MFAKRSLGMKILLSMIGVAAAMLLLAAVIFRITMNNIGELQEQAGRELSATTGAKSSAYLEEMAKNTLLETAGEKADLADGIFSEFESAVRIAADAIAGAGMYLDDMEELVKNIKIGENGLACIIDQKGQVLFSTAQNGSLARGDTQKDQRDPLRQQPGRDVRHHLGGRARDIDRQAQGVQRGPRVSRDQEAGRRSDLIDSAAPARETFSHPGRRSADRSYMGKSSSIRPLRPYFFGQIDICREKYGKLI